MFNIGDRVTLNTENERYRECDCGFCTILKDGGIGVVTKVIKTPEYVDPVSLEVTDKGGREWRGYNFYVDGIKLVETKPHDWEV